MRIWFYGKQPDTKPRDPCKSRRRSNDYDPKYQTLQNIRCHAASCAMDAENEEAKNREVILALNQCLAHAIDLRSRIKQAYWSAKGGNFYMLHKKFNDFTGELDAIADEFAARVLGLGGVPVRTIAIVARTSKLPPYPLGTLKALEHLDAVIVSYEAASTHLPVVMKKVVKLVTIRQQVSSRDFQSCWMSKWDLSLPISQQNG